MASIYGNTVDAFVGTIQRPRKSVELISRPGVNGYGWISGGARAPESRIETISLVANLAAASALRNTFEGLVGTVGTVIDAAGESHTTCLIVACDPQIMAVAGVASVGAMVRCQWSIIAEDA